jgi:uncharacterized membrane protein YgdD (TMEM256/DUF423 family)
VAARQGFIQRPIGLAAIWGFVVGASLFATDVTLRAYLGRPLFPYAAPTGGSLLILDWLVLTAAALAALAGR